MDFTANLITIVVGFAGLVISIVIFMKTTRESKLQNSSALVNTLKVQYDSLDCRESRKRLAGLLLDAATPVKEEAAPGSMGGEGSASTERLVRVDRDSYEALEIFEQLGYLVRRGVIDEGIAWSVFSWDVIRYSHALTRLQCGNHLQHARGISEQPTLFRDFEDLAERMRRVARQESPSRNLDFSWDQIRDFLVVEKCGYLSVYETETERSSSC